MKLGIIGAMQVEIESLKNAMDTCRSQMIAKMLFYEGTIFGQETIVVKSGVGKVNAGICVQILVDYFHVDHVINTGVAGSLNNNLNILDVVISKECVYHDVDATIFGYSQGEVPQLGTAAFPADKNLIDMAKIAIKNVAQETGMIVGRVASGDQFIREAQKKKWIRDVFLADCCEMEGTAIAQACYLNQIPFVILRAISDKADGSDLMQYDQFEKLAAKKCSAITLQILKEIKNA